MSASNCLQLVVNVAPIVTYWSGHSWLMVNTSFMSSLLHVFSSDTGPEPGLLLELLLALKIACSLSWTFALHVDAIAPPSTILAPYPSVYILTGSLY
ncbi:hypothetical protein Tco_1416351 [Tanacetum coccineum]